MLIPKSRIFCFVITLCFAFIGSVHGQLPAISEAEKEAYSTLYYKILYAHELQRLHKIDSISTLAKTTKSPFFKAFALIIGKVLNNWDHSKKEQMISALEILGQEEEIQNCDEARCLLYIELLVIAQEAKNTDKAIKYGLLAKEIFDNYGIDRLYFGSYYASKLSMFYYNFYDYQSSITYGILSTKIIDKSLYAKPIRLNNVGMCYLKLKDYEKAEIYFQQIIDLTTNKEKTTCGIAHANLGNVLRLQGNYVQALPHLYRELELACDAAPEDCAISCLYIADCLLHTDSIPKAKKFIDKAPAYGPNYNQSSFMLLNLEVLAFYYEKLEQYKIASQLQKQLFFKKDSIQSLFKSQMLMRSALKAEQNKINGERQLNMQKIEYNTRLRNIIIASMIIIFLIVLYILNENRKKEKRRFEYKQKEAEKELTRAQEKLHQYLDYLKEKNAFIEKMEKEIQILKPNMTDLEKESYLQDLQKTVILTENDWVKFKNLFEQVWPGKLAQLHQKFPDLNPAEERLLALTELNISSKEKANMLGISIDSLRKSRYRLRKKFPALWKEEELTE